MNSTFFMWCDSWGEASAFAEAHDIATEYPNAPPDEIPGPLNYWRSHTTSQIGARMGYGLGVLARETFTKRFGVYLGCGAFVCSLAALGRGRRRIGLLLTSFDNRLIFVFCGAISTSSPKACTALTKRRVDLGLCMAGEAPTERLLPAGSPS